MASSEAEKLPVGNLAHPADVRQRLVEELRRTLGPLGRATSMALAYLLPGEARWLVTCDACPCSWQGDSLVPCFTSGVEGRYNCGIDVFWDSKLDGSLFVCCDAAAKPLETTIRRVIDSYLRQQQLHKEKDFLKLELTASRLSLEAVYEISSDLRAGKNSQDLLNRILSRATGLQAGLHAVLWLMDEDRLVPGASNNAAGCKERLLEGGLLGRTITNRASILLNGRHKLGMITDLEPELRNAASVAIVPMTSRQETIGVLELWQEEDEPPFDSRMMYLLETLGLLAAMVIESDRLHRGSLANERLQSEVEIGGRIQQTLLLGRAPVDLEVLRAAALTVPSQYIDGDFYDFIEHEQTLDVIVGDVMGKGIPAALVAVATKAHFLRAMNYLLAARGGKLPEPKEILSIVNAELVKQLIGIEKFVTLCYSRFDLQNQTMELIDCGHTRTIHVSGEKGTYSLVQGENMPLGFALGECYQPVRVSFAAGDVFFFYSDGITETMNATGEFYGEARLAELVRGNRSLEPNELIDLVRRQVLAFSGSDVLHDDLTCVAVRIQDTEATIPSKRSKLDLVSDLAELARVRQFVRDFCSRDFSLRFAEGDLDQLELAVAEASTNIIRHGYQGQRDRPIRIQADLFLNRISIRLYHRGQAFNAQSLPVPKLEGPQERGMGLYIIQACVDQVRYYRSKHGENCIHLVKQLGPDSRGGTTGGHNS